MRVTIQVGLGEIFEALCYAGIRVDPNALVAFTRVSGVTRLAFGETFLEEVIKKWLQEVKGYALQGDVHWDKQGLSAEAESTGIPVQATSAQAIPAQTAPIQQEFPASPVSPTSAASENSAAKLTVRLPNDATRVSKDEQKMRQQTMASARREMYEELPPFMQQIHAAANEEAGLPPEQTGPLPEGVYGNYPGPQGKQIVLKTEDEEGT